AAGGRPLTTRQLVEGGNPLEQPLVQFRARHEIRKHEGAAGGHAVLDRATQMVRGGAGGTDEEPIARVERRAAGGERRERASERSPIRRPHESGRAGCDHWRRGGSSSARRSCCTRATIRMAPAADEDACQAMPTSPDDTAL